MSVAPTTQSWSDVAIRHLRATAPCPVCDVDNLRDRRCLHCGADYSGEAGASLWRASQIAADALSARQRLLEAIPRVPAAAAVTVPAPVTDQAASAPAVIPDAAPRSSATVQSVLAIAGAGLFAVAAVVFTFFNPDLQDRALRSVIVGLVTAVFLGGAALLARRALQFSAEAVGALGMVFVALDIYAVSELTAPGLSPWFIVAVATLLSGALMVIVSAAARIRTWLWVSLVGLSAVPVMLGGAGVSSASAVIGCLGSAFAIIALFRLVDSLTSTFDSGLRAERATITALQIVAVVVALMLMWTIAADDVFGYWGSIALVFAAVAVLAAAAAGDAAAGFWSFVAGVAAVAAVLAITLAVDLGLAIDLGARGAITWAPAVIAAAGAVALVVLGAVLPRPRPVQRTPFTAGVLTAVSISVGPSAVSALMIAVASVVDSIALGSSAEGRNPSASGAPDFTVLSLVVAIAVTAVGFGVFARLVGRGTAPRPVLARRAVECSLWLGMLAAGTFACWADLPPAARVAIALAVAVLAGVLVLTVRRMREAMPAVRMPLLLGAHLCVAVAVAFAWTDATLVAASGIPVVLVLAVLSRTMPARVRFGHVGVGYAYALVVFATALDASGVDTIARLCLTSSVGSVGAIVATYIRRLRVQSWYAVLAVTSVPFLVGIAQVLFERSGWTALSTGLMFLLALTLVLTRRPGLGAVLRATAAALLVPSLAVVVVCLGAQVLLESASPLTLPVIAAVVALVLPSTGVIGDALARRGINRTDAVAVRSAVEASALVTGAIAAALALIRVAAGLPTTFLVLLILGLGAAAMALATRRRYGWWVAAACFTGALWCVWAIAGVDVIEPYLLPPSIAAAVVAVILTARGMRAMPLYAAGLVVAAAPLLVVLAVSGSGQGPTPAWRAFGLVAASWVLLVMAHMLGRSPRTVTSPTARSVRARRLRILAVPTLAVAILTGAAGAVQGVRWGVGADTAHVDAVALVVVCLGIGLGGAVPAAAAGYLLRAGAAAGSPLSSSRWLMAPAAAYAAIAAWTAIERDWFVVWTMWSLMLGYLSVMVAVARRSRIRSTGLPPVWLLFAIAFTTAVVAWSPRDLRVEWFSLPLGLFLLAAGAVSQVPMTGTDRSRPATVTSWPAGWTGSWPRLAPGIVVTVLASIVATFTDPLTWRAIAVIGIALISILVGSRYKLAAPFIIGVVVLPVENVLVFMVQIGRGIESMPWWITLAVVGAVLLIIAVTYERRAGEANTIGARLRDLA